MRYFGAKTILSQSHFEDDSSPHISGSESPIWIDLTFVLFKHVILRWINYLETWLRLDNTSCYYILSIPPNCRNLLSLLVFIKYLISISRKCKVVVLYQQHWQCLILCLNKYQKTNESSTFGHHMVLFNCTGQVRTKQFLKRHLPKGATTLHATTLSR
jgi:hypothetical protein